jgi:SMC interacting uncharacterized protein involved in chromosome segregation
MRNLICSLTIFAILTSCGVPQKDFDKIKTENEQLKKEILKLEFENSELKTLNKKLEEKKLEASYHTETEALKLLKDYYEFYNADMIYRHPKVRRVNNNTFSISLEACVKKGDFQNNDFFWNSQVLTLMINPDGTYKIN